MLLFDDDADDGGNILSNASNLLGWLRVCGRK